MTSSDRFPVPKLFSCAVSQISCTHLTDYLRTVDYLVTFAYARRKRF